MIGWMAPDHPEEPVAAAVAEAAILAVRGPRVERVTDRLAGEEPLQIRVAGGGADAVDVAVTMRTPGHEDELGAGFLFTEGIAAAEALRSAAYSFGDPGSMAQPHDEVTVTLPATFDRSRVAERAAIATASCGICGKASVDDVAVRCAALPPGPRIARTTLLGLSGAMRDAQSVFKRTGGLHAAARFDPRGQLVALREDVGRHNALDKLIGAAVLSGDVPVHDAIVLVSGRVSFEITQKAAVAGVPVLAAISAPSDLAVATARRVGMTLVGFLGGDGFNVYAGEERLELDA
jgi:FdhD protein